MASLKSLAKDTGGSCGVEVSTRVKCCYQVLVSREMRKQAKLNLRVVAGEKIKQYIKI